MADPPVPTLCEWYQHAICSNSNTENLECVKERLEIICPLTDDCDNFTEFSEDVEYPYESLSPENRLGKLATDICTPWYFKQYTIEDKVRDFYMPEFEQKINCFKQELLSIDPTATTLGDFNEKTLTDEQRAECKAFITKFEKYDVEGAIKNKMRDYEYYGDCMTKIVPKMARALAYYSAVIGNVDHPLEDIKTDEAKFRKLLIDYHGESIKCYADQIKEKKN